MTTNKNINLNEKEMVTLNKNSIKLKELIIL